MKLTLDNEVCSSPLDLPSLPPLGSVDSGPLLSEGPSKPPCPKCCSRRQRSKKYRDLEALWNLSSRVSPFWFATLSLLHFLSWGHGPPPPPPICPHPFLLCSSSSNLETEERVRVLVFPSHVSLFTSAVPFVLLMPQSFPEEAGVRGRSSRPMFTFEIFFKRLPNGAEHDALQCAWSSSTFFFLHR